MNVRIQYNIPFIAGVWWNDTLCMNNYLMRLSMITNCSDPESHNIAFERMKYFVYSKLCNSVMINQGHVEQCQSLVAAGVKITTMPAEPVDQIVGLVLHSKINAVMEDRLILVESEISSELGDNMIYFHSEDETSAQEFGAGWWQESDPTHYDAIIVHQDKVVPIHGPSVWRELNLSWPEPDAETPKDNTVVFAEFVKNETE